MGNKLNKGFLLALLLLFIGCTSVYLIKNQYRNFYKINNSTFTIWHTPNGYYVLPYKYFGITYPKRNYLLSSNACSTDIFIGKDSSLFVFSNSYILDKSTSFVCFNSLSWKYKYLQNDLLISRSEVDDSVQLYIKNGYPQISIRTDEFVGHGVAISTNE